MMASHATLNNLLTAPSPAGRMEVGCSFNTCGVSRSVIAGGRQVSVNPGTECSFFPVKDVTTKPPTEQPHQERECVHRRAGAQGDFYPGARFVHALQRMRGEAALALSRKVGAFFWSDAARLSVWLCHDCAREASLARPAAEADAA